MNDTKDTTLAQDVLNQIDQQRVGSIVSLDSQPPTARPPWKPPTPQQTTPPQPAMLEMTEEVGALFTALAKAQGEFGAIERTLTARIKSKREGGADFGYSYAPLDVVLDAVRPALSKNGIAVVQAPMTRQHAVTVRTMLVHGESEQRVWNDLTVGCVSTDAKDIGSAITYAKRYALQSMLGIAPDTDDDGIASRGERAQIKHRLPPSARQDRQDAATPKPPKPEPVDGAPSLIIACRQGERNGQKVYAIRTITGEHWTSDEKLYAAANKAMHADRLVTLVTESKVADTTGKTYSELIEIVE